MSDFFQGMLLWAAGIATVVLFVYYLGHMGVYIDNLHTQRIAECQANGYSWGECWNVIVGDQSAFAK